MSWPKVKLRELVTLTGGHAFKSGDFEASGIPLIRIGTANSGTFKTSDFVFLPQEYKSKYSKYLVRPKDLLITLTGTVGKGDYGNVCEATDGYESYLLNQRVAKININSRDLSKRYLYLFLATPEVKKNLTSLSRGVRQANIKNEDILNLEIPLPSLDEQKRIAAILDKANAIRRKRQQAIQLADDFLRSVFLDMFGDPVTNPKGWELNKISSITTDWRGGAPFKPNDFTDEGVNVLHKGAIQRNNNVLIDTKKKTYTSEAFAKKYKKSEVDQSFLAVTLRDLVPSGPSIGLISNLKGSIGKNYILAQGAYGFRCKEDLVKPSYLVYLTNNNSFRSTLSKYWVGSTQIHIRTPIFKEIEIPVPPINIQDEFEKVVKKHRTQFNKSLETIAGSEALFNSLSQKAFAGEL